MQQAAARGQCLGALVLTPLLLGSDIGG